MRRGLRHIGCKSPRQEVAIRFALALFGLCSVAAAEEGRLRMEAIDQVIEKSDHAVQSCHRTSRRDTRAVLLRLEIDAAGAVVAAQPVDKPSGEAACLQRVARHLHFPATGVTTRVEYPFMLLPR